MVDYDYCDAVCSYIFGRRGLIIRICRDFEEVSLQGGERKSLSNDPRLRTKKSDPSYKKDRSQ